MSLLIFEDVKIIIMWYSLGVGIDILRSRHFYILVRFLIVCPVTYALVSCMLLYALKIKVTYSQMHACMVTCILVSYGACT